MSRLFGRARAKRRTPLPEAAREALGLEHGGTVLAWSSLVGGGWAVATPAGVQALLPSGTAVDRPWTDVDHVAWDQDSGMLAVWWVGSRQPAALELEGGSFLPEVVHERVRSSLVLARDVPVPGGRTVWVALRKADDGTLSTQVAPGRGVRLSDPDVVTLVTQARAALREEAGAGPEGERTGGPPTRLGPI
jgi:hypothetical protein